MKLPLIISFLLASHFSYGQSPCVYDTASYLINLFHCDTLSIKMDIARFHGRASKVKSIKVVDFINYRDQLLIWVPGVDGKELITIEKNGQLVHSINPDNPITLIAQSKRKELFFIYSTHNLKETIATFKQFTNNIVRVELVTSGSESGYYVHGYNEAIKIGNPPSMKEPTSKEETALTLIMNRRTRKYLDK